MSKNEEFDRTIGFAETAVERIRESQIPAYPKTYEVLYTHLTGMNADLSATINDMYKKFGRLSAGQILHLHENFIENSAFGDKVDVMSAQINDEANNLEKIIQKSHSLSQSFSVSLRQAAEDLKIDLDQSTLQKLIKRVAIETLAIESHNMELISELQIAQQNIQLLHRNLEEVRVETLMDPLTQIGNRRHFDRSLSKAIASNLVSREPLCLIMADVDHFKSFNDKWGHQTGDQVLRLVALAIKGNIKAADIACRYGGEEFAIILPNTHLDQGKIVAQRILMSVAKRDVVKRSTGENLGRITISAGIAKLMPEEAGESLIKRADSYLYEAKKAGRNCVITEKDSNARKVA